MRGRRSSSKDIADTGKEIFEQVHTEYTFGGNHFYSLRDSVFGHAELSGDDQVFGNFIDNVRRQFVELFVIDQFLDFFVALAEYAEHRLLLRNLDWRALCHAFTDLEATDVCFCGLFHRTVSDKLFLNTYRVNLWKSVLMSPKEIVEKLLQSAKLIHTPSGDGDMVWQAWGEPTQRPPLLLLHGGFGSWTHWLANVEALSQDRLVVTCDMPGLGDSASAPGELAPDIIAAPIIAGLDQVFGKDVPFDLAGFSFGGLIGSRVAAAVGNRCRTFIAVGASGFEGLHVRVLGIEVPAKDASDDEKNTIHRSNLNILLLWDEANIDDVAIYTHRKNVARSRVRSRPMSLGNHWVDALPRISAKMAGIWGVHDATAGGREQIMERQDVFRRFQPDAEVKIIEDAGHWVMYERPEEFNAMLLAMLDNV